MAALYEGVRSSRYPVVSVSAAARCPPIRSAAYDIVGWEVSRRYCGKRC